jgi:hypothetical protein
MQINLDNSAIIHLSMWRHVGTSLLPFLNSGAVEAKDMNSFPNATQLRYIATSGGPTKRGTLLKANGLLCMNHPERVLCSQLLFMIRFLSDCVIRDPDLGPGISNMRYYLLKRPSSAVLSESPNHGLRSVVLSTVVMLIC